jgi:dipeptidyl aminopeptidase/acylaminoacyl peptidase
MRKSLLLICLMLAATNASAAADFSLTQVLDYPFVSATAASPKGDRLAWIRELGGARNVWVAQAPGNVPRQLTQATEDDGQELTQLTFSPDGNTLLYVRGGDHDQNWPAAGDLAPNPAAATAQPMIGVWLADLAGNAPPRRLADGDAPAISANGTIVFVRDHQIWTVGRDGSNAHRLFFDRGHDRSPVFSPDGSRLAFVSDRGDHAFIGIYSAADKPISFMSPSTGRDDTPMWSPDGKRLAYVRQPAQGVITDLWFVPPMRPWSVMVSDAATGAATVAWRAPNTKRGAIPFTGNALRFWGADDTLALVTTLDGWPHLYALPAAGGEPKLLTPGAFMVEQTSLTPDHTAIVYTANTGPDAHDGERRHVFRVALSGGAPVQLTHGAGIEADPVAMAQQVAYVGSDTQNPPVVTVLAENASTPAKLPGQDAPADFPASQLIAPVPVTFRAADGLTVHADLFRAQNAVGRQPAIVFVHGGPVRQMLLGWHYMDYYANAYAVNQYMAAHGYTVLALNYRLGIGYGQDYLEPAHGGAKGASEYQDVQAASAFLRNQDGVDGTRIGIWGGSYGGYLTAMALARDSATFKAGVDIHGVHDWRMEFDQDLAQKLKESAPDAYAAEAKEAYLSSPIAAIDRWRSPVLLIQGDDDRNVHFSQTVDLAGLLRTRPVAVEELILPNEVHDFRRHASWAAADAATVGFFERKFK